MSTIARATPGIVRGCGRRVEGGVYLECGTAPGGAPLEHFFCDPPIPYEPDHKIGVDIQLGPDGLYHVVDYVGSEHYPWTADFIEEGRCYGFSRRVPRNLDFSKLQHGSRMLFVHARGYLANAKELHPHFIDPELKWRCGLWEKYGRDDHLNDPAIACSRDWYALAPATSATQGGIAQAVDPQRVGARSSNDVQFRREVTEAISYRVYPVAPDAPDPVCKSAIVASVPITNISVVKARDGSHKETLERIRGKANGINVEESDG